MLALVPFAAFGFGWLVGLIIVVILIVLLLRLL